MISKHTVVKVPWIGYDYLIGAGLPWHQEQISDLK